jgi:heme exporter protein B
LSRIREYLQAVRAILWKDLVVEWRSHELISGMLVFAILAILIFNFALELEIHTSAGLSSGILWVTLVFTGTIGLNRSMAAEKDRGCLDGLLLAPVDRSAILFGKVLGNWLFMLLVAVILLPLYAILYSVNLVNTGLLLVVILGTAGYALTGTLLAAMSIQTRTRDMLLPILLFPVAFPLLLAAVKAGSGFLQGFTMVENQAWIALLVVYDVIFTAMGLMLFDVIMEE